MASSSPSDSDVKYPSMVKELDRKTTFLFHQWPDTAPLSPTKLAKAGLFYEGIGDQVRCFACGQTKDNWQPNQDTMTVHLPHCPFVIDPNLNQPLPVQENLSPSPGHDHPALVRNDLARSSDGMKTEQARLLTFRSKKWPKTHIVHPVELARAGFYYEGKSDVVRCAYCKGRLQDWSRGDLPLQEHRNHFPRCSFIQSQAPESPRTALHPPSTSVNETPADPSPRRSMSPMSTEEAHLHEMGIFARQPSHSEMATYQARLQSFNGWPADKRQRPHELALAGFYYAGDADNVKCFHCDGGLHNWLPNDSPYTEHARWYPTCDYLLLSKGQEFVDAVQANKDTPSSASPSGAKILEDFPRPAPTKLIDLIELGTDVNNSQILLLKDMGYAEELLVQALVSNRYQLFESIGRFIDRLEELRHSESSSSAAESDIECSSGCVMSGVAAPRPQDTSARSELRSVSESSSSSWEQKTCKICMDAEVSVVILPCGHLCCCPTCSPALKLCPICRKEIKGFVRTYLA